MNGEQDSTDRLRSHIDPILRAMESQIIAVRAILATAPEVRSGREADESAERDDVEPAVEPTQARSPAEVASEALLTPREREVLSLLLDEGSSNGAIAARLGIRERTVKAHLRSIFRKLKVTRRAEAIVAVLSSERGIDSA
ncbi:MAG TPA: helix-turn-helix transcriptional regulator [Acidimicrobiales bacterium]|nr:helix-turn-helix transcriptional regulator [Acidimicrobiales bacterium]